MKAEEANKLAAEFNAEKEGEFNNINVNKSDVLEKMGFILRGIDSEARKGYLEATFGIGISPSVSNAVKKELEELGYKVDLNIKLITNVYSIIYDCNIKVSWAAAENTCKQTKDSQSAELQNKITDTIMEVLKKNIEKDKELLVKNQELKERILGVKQGESVWPPTNSEKSFGAPKLTKAEEMFELAKAKDPLIKSIDDEGSKFIDRVMTQVKEAAENGDYQIKLHDHDIPNDARALRALRVYLLDNGFYLQESSSSKSIKTFLISWLK